MRGILIAKPHWKKDKHASDAHILMMGSVPGGVGVKPFFAQLPFLQGEPSVCRKKRGQLEKRRWIADLCRAGEELSLGTGMLGQQVLMGVCYSKNGAGGKERLASPHKHE